jgi:hypothetical protein
MAKPKLALIPAAQGSKFYSVLPSDGVGDFQFSRLSSGTRIAPTGLIETVPIATSRLNYDLLNGKVVNCPHYLLEPARTNLINYSQAISNAPIKAGTYTDNFAISPDGSLNATKLTATDIDPYFYQNISYSAASYTASIYIKGIGNSVGKSFQIRLASNIYTDTIPLEWTRFEYTVTMPSGSSNVGVEIPNPAVVGDEVLVWGWQLEQGSYPTSYIPTNGTTISRIAESADFSGDAATFNDSEGVLMAEIAALANDLTFRLIALKGTSDDIRFGYRTTSNAIYVDAPNAFLVATLNDIKTFNKVAIKYGATGTKFFINGFELGVDADDSSFSGIDTLDFDVTGSSNFFGKTRELQYFDSALTDAQLETLTSWTSLQEMITSQLYTNY